MDDLIPSPKIDENRCTVVQNRWESIKNVVLSCFFLKNRWKSLYCRSKSMEFDAFYIKNNNSVAEVPNKVEKTSSGNTTFANSEHPYRTCGLSAGSFDSIVVATCWYQLLAATICFYLLIFLLLVSSCLQQLAATPWFQLLLATVLATSCLQLLICISYLLLLATYCQLLAATHYQFVVANTRYCLRFEFSLFLKFQNSLPQL